MSSTSDSELTIEMEEPNAKLSKTTKPEESTGKQQTIPDILQRQPHADALSFASQNAPSCSTADAPSSANCNTMCPTAVSLSYAASSTPSCSRASDKNHSTLKDMFPTMSDKDISETLESTNYDIQNAIEEILSGSVSNSNEAYASFHFCNDDDIELEDTSTADVILATELENESNTPLSTLIKDLSAEKILPEETLRIKVRRSYVWDDAKNKIGKCTKNDLCKTLKVQFVGEPAVDQGGPRNEFFTLLHKQINSSSLFTGEPGKKLFSHNVPALQRNDFLIYGQLCSLGVMQGSPSPAFFASPAVDYILYGKLEKVKIEISDVPNAKAKNKLQELDAMNDPVEFKQAASFNCPLRFKAGFSKPIVTLEDKSDLMQCIALHHTLLFSLPELDQFIEGLKLNGFLELIRQEPNKSRCLFEVSQLESLTAEKVDDLFLINLSPQGSNRRASEEVLSLNLSKFLEDVESSEVSSTLMNVTTDTESMVTLSLADVLQFITGSSSIPAVGFEPRPSVAFIADNSGRKLYVSTCTNTLTLPICDILMEYESFKKEVTACIIMSPGFGNV